MTHDTPARSTDPDATLLETRPTLRPTVVRAVLALAVGLGVVGFLYRDPGVFGDPEAAEVIANVALAGTGIVLFRYLLRAYVLTRTRYVVTPTAVRGEYRLLYRAWARELPLDMVRSYEFRQSRVETVIGCGTVSFLTGGVDQGLGVLTFEHVANPDEVRALASDLLGHRARERGDRSDGGPRADDARDANERPEGEAGADAATEEAAR